MKNLLVGALCLVVAYLAYDKFAGSRNSAPTASVVTNETAVNSSSSVSGRSAGETSNKIAVRIGAVTFQGQRVEAQPSTN